MPFYMRCSQCLRPHYSTEQMAHYTSRRSHATVAKALCMSNEVDMNTAHDIKSICSAALLNDNANDSKSYLTLVPVVRVAVEQQFLNSRLLIHY